jgi:hypothetical protein
MNPYANDLAHHNALEVLATTPVRIHAIVSQIGPDGAERTYAPGKWTVRQLLIHLAHAEFVFGIRIRMALSQNDYVVQPYDQDRWMEIDGSASADAALAAYEGLRAMNLAMFRALTPEDFQRGMSHPEYGPMVVADVIGAIAGHELHHLPHFEAVA